MSNSQELPRPARAPRGTLAIALVLALASVLAMLGPAGTGELPLGPAPAADTQRVSDVPALGDPDGPVAMQNGEVAQASPEGSPRPSPSPTKPGEKKPDLPFYAPYLKAPVTLGFQPDALLFETVYHQVKTQHIDQDPDEKLYGGVAKEVGALLAEAKIGAEDLAKMPRDKNLPQEIVRTYGGRVNVNLLWYAMIRGLLEGTEDPYSVLMTPKEYHMLMEQMQNESFGGIGVFIELDRDHKDQLTVVEPLEGTPAARAGLLPGDQLVKIDGLSTQGWSLDQATAHIRGRIGSTVTLTIRRGADGPLKDFQMQRAAIEVASVTHKMLPDKVGYVRLRLFGSKTGKELDAALDALTRDGARAIVVDLRNNGGGYINAAVDVCSHFVPPGALVTYVTKKHGERSEYNGEARERTRLPVVLLVNQFSASASEITAGCFKDYGAATLMGTKTFGKGSVQQLYPLPNGAALKLTIAHFFTPKGSKINKIGVEPDVKIEMEPRNVGRGDKDLQLQKALDYLKTKGII